MNRTLHLIDFENLAGAPTTDADTAARVGLSYRAAARVLPGDLCIVSASHYTALAAHTAFPSARLVVKSGPNGADLALIAAFHDEPNIQHRFKRVTIGSGDGAFIPIASAARKSGLTVVAVTRPGCIHRTLARTVDTCRVVAPESRMTRPAWLDAVPAG